jgi:glucose/mannose-6-phosphate isomerase
MIKELVQKYDPENQFEVLRNYYKQIEYSWNNKIDLSSIKKHKIKNIVISGLGGSAIAGDLIQNYLNEELNIPLFINRNYYTPSFINFETLFIASSYSGNTEETIESLNKAKEHNCIIICITTGGEIEKIAIENNYPIIKLQNGYQPRFSIGLSFFTLLKIFQELNFIQTQGEIVSYTINLWKRLGEEYSAESNITFCSAEKLLGFVPIIYSVENATNSLGNRLKSQLAENAKMPSFANIFPEFNHNEIVAWESYSENQFRAKVIIILDESYHPQVKRRINIVSEIIKKAGAEIIYLESSELTYKKRLLDLVYKIDWITYYSAILRKKDPSEIDNIHFLKKHLSK